MCKWFEQQQGMVPNPKPSGAESAALPGKTSMGHFQGLCLSIPPSK